MSSYLQKLIAQEKIPPKLENDFVPFSRYILKASDIKYLSRAAAEKVIMPHLQLPQSVMEPGMLFADNCGPAALFHLLQMTKAVKKDFKFRELHKLLTGEFGFDENEGMDGSITPKVVAKFGLQAVEKEVVSVQDLYHSCMKIKGIALCAIMESYTEEEYQQDPQLEVPGGHYCVFAGLHINGAVIINSSTETGRARKSGEETFTVQVFGKNYLGDAKVHPFMRVLTDFAVEHDAQITKEGVSPPSVWYPYRVWVICKK